MIVDLNANEDLDKKRCTEYFLYHASFWNNCFNWKAFVVVGVLKANYDIKN